MLPVLAQVEEASNRQLDLKSVRKLKRGVEKNASLEDGLQAQLLELYDQAIADLQAAAQAKARVRDYQRERSNMERKVATLRSRLSSAERKTEFSLPEEATAERLESLLARELVVLASLRVALGDVEALSEERLRRRSEIAQRLGALDQQMESLNAELRSASEFGVSGELKQAAQTRLLARREALLGESESLRAELRLVEERAVLVPWQRDLAELRVGRSEGIAALMEKTLLELRQSEAQKSLQEIQNRSKELAERLPRLAGRAEEIEHLAQMLWAPDGVMAQSLITNSALAQTRKNITYLESTLQLTRRRFEAVGHRGDITQWWPIIPQNFPRITEIRREIRQREVLIPEVQHQLIQYEQERVRFREFEKVVSEFLEETQQAESGAVTPEIRRLVWDLVRTRRELLDTLIDYYGRYSSRLVEFITVLSNFLALGEELKSFAYERVLWARSVSGSILPTFNDSVNAVLWIGSSGNWLPFFGELSRGVVGFPFRTLGLILLFGFLVRYRNRMSRRLEVLAGRVGNPESDSFVASLEALLHTILLAAPLPLGLYLASRMLASSDHSFLVNAGDSLKWVAIVHGLLEVTRQWLRPKGFAEAHLGWPAEVIRPIRNSLFWPQILFLPPLYIALHFCWAGLSLSSPAELQAYNNSLGRIAFIVGVGGLGIFLFRVFHIRPWGDPTKRRASLFTLLFVNLGLLVPAGLAIFGFYVTGILLAYQMLRSAWLAVGIMILGGLFHRWLVTSRRRLADRSVSQQSAGDDTGTVLVAQSSQMSEEDLSRAAAGARGLVHFILVLIAAVGVLSIWSQAIPTLQIIKRIQVWPTVQLTEERDDGRVHLTAVLAPEAEGAVARGETESNETASSTGLGPMEPPAPGSGKSEASSVLTLWNLLGALLAGFVTAFLAKNIPGVLEFSLLKRTKLDSGARIAFGTLVRYTIVILGITVSCGFLGITWSKVQWLAAALTFGLGFGLQEIVANFVSGLILLVERPVRVGDVVKIGDLLGRVTRTQIRATTIALFDRSEMIVPNKDFITKTLVNLTLHDSKRRVDISVRVPYGTSVSQVKRVLLEVAERHPDVLKDPGPLAVLVEFGDDALKFNLMVFVDFGQGLTAKDELQVAIDQAFRDEGVEFALPKLTIQVPETPKE